MTSKLINIGAANGCSVPELKKFIRNVYNKDSNGLSFMDNEWLYLEIHNNEMFLISSHRAHTYFNMLKLDDIQAPDDIWILNHDEIKGLKDFFKGVKQSDDITISIHDKYTAFYVNDEQFIITHDLNGSRPFDVFAAMDQLKDISYHEITINKKDLNVLSMFECYNTIINNHNNKLLFGCYDQYEIKNVYVTNSNNGKNFNVCVTNSLLKRVLNKICIDKTLKFYASDSMPLFIKNGFFTGCLANRLNSIDTIDITGYETILKNEGVI